MAESWKNMYKNYKLLDWLCSQKLSTQILILQYAYTTDKYLTVYGVSCTNIDQKGPQIVAKSWKNVYKNYLFLTIWMPTLSQISLARTCTHID